MDKLFDLKSLINGNEERFKKMTGISKNYKFL